MKKYYIIIVFIMMLMIQSCIVKDTFTLYPSKTENIEVRKMSVMGTFEEVNDNSVMLSEGGFIALKKYGITDLVSDITVDIKEGEGAMFALRSASNNNELHPAILFTYSKNGFAVQEKGKPLISLDKYKAIEKEPSRIVFINDGKRYDIIVDCDSVYTGFTEIPNTEYLLIRTLPKSKVLITGINMIEKGEEEEGK